MVTTRKRATVFCSRAGEKLIASIYSVLLDLGNTVKCDTEIGLFCLFSLN